MKPVPMQWRKGPKPDPDVIALVQELHEAVEQGLVRVISITVVTPTLQIETKQAGDLDHVKSHLLAAGLLKASQKLLSNGASND